MTVSIRNGEGKLVCVADANKKSVEIIREGIKTTVVFTENGKLTVKHIEIKDTS